ncbi:MAG: helix-turn-helix domain-containing protein [Geobacter sp.]|nr:helix-turn-helix domain-containing protein [Geobacter sp.]
MTLQERVKTIREGLAKTQKEMAGLVDVGLRTWQQYEEGVHDPSWKVVLKLAELGCNADWLATGKGKMWREGFGPELDRMVAAAERIDAIHEMIHGKRSEQQQAEGYVQIPRYEIAASAGGGAVVQSEQIVDYLTFKAEWLKMSLGLSPPQAAVISVIGDSMEPYLSDGDLILVDTSVARIENDAIYVIQSGDSLLVKRIQKKLDGTVIVKSDNERYEPEIFRGESTELLRVVGRLVRRLVK